MSYDVPVDNRTFRETESFPYRLLSDPDRTVSRRYDAVRPPGDPRPDYPRRISYLIDPNGIVAASYEVTDTATHPATVLADLERLTRRS